MEVLRLRPTGGARAGRRRVAFRTSGAARFLLVGCVCFSVLVQRALSNSGVPGPQAAEDGCTTSADSTTCTCQAAAAGRAITGKDFAATLSEESPHLKLTCSGTNVTGAPLTMGQGDVCPKKATLEACKTARANQRQTSVIQLNSLLAQGTASVSWQGEGSGQKTYSVAIPKDAFPLVDGEFSVGCMVNDNTGCMVSVTLKARKTATAGQTVTCAYGSSSNEKRQSVTVTPSNNKLTISCGDGGTVLPGNGASCCVYDETSAADDCKTQPFTDIFSGFMESWWNNEAASQATLTVPAGEFPVDDKKFLVGCKYSTTESPSARNGVAIPPSPASPSVCTVEVTVQKQPPTTTTTSSTSSGSISPSLFARSRGGVLAVATFFCALPTVFTLK